MAKKKTKQASASEFETLVVATCLAGKIVRGEYGSESMDAAIAGDVSRWRALAQAAARALGQRSKGPRE
jgi:hypothetical protein